ncbi:hypothetical protein PVAND_015902 [Polypedilum vanderplanki]|uniref:Uncharacterized protein n=1 Tax=Polypedilum vanderplanki TaxID=319348 RepID=A0A9J6BDH7_POLVA|nr:hypothetical protein PVAND_015902 [Polypedilum vanderplanki]
MVVHDSVATCHRLCSLEKFLCCIELETGAIILGWFSFLRNVVTMLLAVVAILIRIFVPCEDIVEGLRYMDFNATVEKCVYATEEGFVTMISFFIIVISIGLTYISYRFVVTMKTRNHKEVIPFMTYIGLMTLLSFVAIFRLTWSAIIIGTVTGLFYGYFLLCVGAMYERFLKEHHEKQMAIAECENRTMEGSMKKYEEGVWNVEGVQGIQN